nr:uncharacterized mitochondrial protein AtMg00810-like [Tanacetum cinerariifolium]
MSYLIDYEEIDGGYVAFGGNPKGGKITRKGNPQMDLQDQGVIDNGCSRHMIGNMSYLTDYEEIDRGYVTFGGNPKGGKITGKYTIKTGSGLDWLFDINALTRTMNYEPIVAGTQCNGFTDPKSSNHDGSKPLSDDGNKVDEDLRKVNECKDQEKEDNVNNTNNVNTLSSAINTAGTNEVNVVSKNISIELPFDPNMPALEDVSTFDFSSDDEDNGAVADMNNLDTTIQVSLIPTTRIHKDHPLDQVIRDLQSATQTRKMSKNLEEHGFTEVKTASTPMETLNPLLKDEDGEEVDVHMYRSMIGSLMYLTSSRPDIMFPVYACARYQVNPKVSHLHAVKRIFRYLKGQSKLGRWYPKDSPFDFVAYTDSDYARESMDKKSTIEGCQFLGCRLISWQCKKQTVVANFATEAEYVAASSCCGHVLWIHNQLLDYGDYARESMDRKSTIEGCQFLGCRLISWQCKKQTVVANFATEAEYFWSTATAKTINEEAQLHGKVNGKKIIATESFVRRDLRQADEEDEAVHKELGDKLVRAAITTASLKVEQDSGNTLRSDEDRLKLDELMALCNTLQNKVLDLEKTKTTNHNEIASLKRMVKKLEKKNRSRTHKLKRLYKGRRIDAIDVDEDITLVNDVDNEIFDVNMLGGEEMFVAGQNENVVEERKKRKHFAAKRSKEKRNKPSTKAQQRKIMCTYLKDMEGYKLKDLKLKEFDRIQKMFDRAFRRVNVFEDFKTELVKGKEKRVGEELIQESTKKQKVEDDKETSELKQLMEIFLDEEEVAIDAIPLAVKSPRIVD